MTNFTLFGTLFKLFFTCVCMYLKTWYILKTNSSGQCHAHLEYMLLIPLLYVTARCYLCGFCGLMMNPAVSFHSSSCMCSLASLCFCMCAEVMWSQYFWFCFPWKWVNKLNLANVLSVLPLSIQIEGGGFYALTPISTEVRRVQLSLPLEVACFLFNKVEKSV